MRGLRQVGAYILGEFGHLIAASPASQPTAILALLTSKWQVLAPTVAALCATVHGRARARLLRGCVRGFVWSVPAGV